MVLISDREEQTMKNSVKIAALLAIVVAIVIAIVSAASNNRKEELRCKYEECTYEKTGEFYCDKHNCDFEDCINKVVEYNGIGLCKYCTRHQCGAAPLMDDCDNCKMEGYDFCEKHKCREDGCNTYAYRGYCEHHGD